MLNVKKVNDFTVKPVKIPKEQQDLGIDIFPQLYSNVYICAPKKSGKSTLIFNILKHMRKLHKNTTFFVFSGSIDNDPIYKKLQEKAMPIDIEDEDGHKVVVNLGNTPTKKKKKREPWQMFLFSSLNEGLKETGISSFDKMLQVIKSAPDDERFVCVIDDLAEELKIPIVSNTIRRNRHLKITFILASQSYKLLPKNSRENIDVYLLLKNIPKEKLEALWEDAALTIDFETLFNLYKKITSNSFNFLYIDRPDIFRINFNKQILFE